jgi:putative endonuclease
VQSAMNKSIIEGTDPIWHVDMDGSQFYVYIMTDELHNKLYTGRTSNLKRRISQHRSGNGGVFTRTWSLNKLVYYEFVDDVGAARLREKRIKRSSKKLRVKLIEGMNPDWSDLFDQL